MLFLSGRTDPATRLRGFESGGRDYVTKPFAEAEVLARVALHVNLARRPSAAPTVAWQVGDAPRG